jgi:hypothetical protein
MGVKAASPRWNCSGLDVSVLPGCDGGEIIGVEEDAVVDGNIGVVLATSGRVAALAAPGLAAFVCEEASVRPGSGDFVNASSLRVNSSIWRCCCANCAFI